MALHSEECITTSFLVAIGNLAHHWLGEGGAYKPPPLANFLNNSKRGQISTPNLRYLIQHQFGIRKQTFSKIRREVFEKMAF